MDGPGGPKASPGPPRNSYGPGRSDATRLEFGRTGLKISLFNCKPPGGTTAAPPFGAWRFGEVFLALGILGVCGVLGINVCSGNPNAKKRVKVPRRKEQKTH